MSSSILNESPRLQIRDRDNRPGSNPTVINSFGDGRTGVRTMHFNDQNTVIFKTSDNVSYPHVLDETSAYLSASSLSRTGSLLVTTGAIVKGVSDTTLVNLYDDASTPGPFIEDGLFEQVETDFFLTGTSLSILPGFDSPLSSKTIIRIDLSANEEQILTRYADGRGSAQDPEGRFLGQNFTGFCYYNFDLKRWEQKGLEDPGTGGLHHFDYAVERDAGLNESSVISGTGNFPLQFIPDPGKDNLSATDTATQNEYARIGTPTVSCFAPFGNQYHATASQTIKLKDYIQHPFLLEKAVVHLPIEAEKSAADFFQDYNFIVNQDNYVFFIYRQPRNLFSEPVTLFGQVAGKSPTRGFPDSKVHIDSPQFVSSTLRHLVLSCSVAFYNGTASKGQADIGALTGRDEIDTYTFSPVNTPSFQYDWRIDPFATGVSSYSVLGQFTGSVTLEALPAVASAQTLGHFKVPRSDTSLTTTDVTKIWNYWPGGTSVYPFGHGNQHGKFSLSFNYWAYRSPSAGGTYNNPAISFGYPTFDAYSDPLSPGTLSFKDAKRELPIEYVDSRTQKIFGGTNDGIFVPGVGVTFGAQQSSVSPYLLLPDDELIIGMEAGIGMSDGMSHCSMTGSFLTIKTGKASLTLYGSLIKEGKEFHQGINQELTSENTTEYLHFDNVSVDQFEIRGKDDYTNSLSDSVFAGSPYSNDPGLFNNFFLPVGARRKYISEISLPRTLKTAAGSFSYDWLLFGHSPPHYGQPNSGTQASNAELYFEGIKYPRKGNRQKKLFSVNERFYDTLMPDVKEFLSPYYLTVNSYVKETETYDPPTNPHNVPQAASLGSDVRILKDWEPGDEVTTTPTGAQWDRARSDRLLETNGSRGPKSLPYEGNPKRFLQQEKVWYIAVSASVPPDSLARNPAAPWANKTYNEVLITNQNAVLYVTFARGFKCNLFYQVGIEYSGPATDSNLAAGRNGYPFQHSLKGSSGYRYGVQGILPKHSSVIFRPNRYGQFRDMLEQRKYGTFFDEVGISPDGQLSGRTGLKDGPITVQFKSPTEQGFVSGSDPGILGSSNRSTSATSSLPYNDGKFSNWSSVF